MLTQYIVAALREADELQYGVYMLLTFASKCIHPGRKLEPPGSDGSLRW